MKDILKLMRIKHWIKNRLIVFPVFFAGEIFDTQNLLNLICGFISYGLVASAVYVINDIQDVEKDRAHEVKCKRPIASGRVPIATARVLVGVLLILAFLTLQFLDQNRGIEPYIWELLYLILNVAYSMGLKKVPIVDIVVLTLGFVIRVFFGAAICNIIVSSWLVLTVVAFALYMSIGKRRNELIKTEGSHTRDVLMFYDRDLLDKFMTISETLGIVFYSLWAATIRENQYIALISLIVITVIMRYEIVIRRDSYGDPVEVLLSDKWLMVLVVFFSGSMILFTYFLK